MAGQLDARIRATRVPKHRKHEWLLKCPGGALATLTLWLMPAAEYDRRIKTSQLSGFTPWRLGPLVLAFRLLI